MPLSPLSVDSVVSQSDQCLAATVGKEVVVMSIEKGAYFSLNPTAVSIWERIAKPCKIRDLCSALALEYAASASDIEADVLALLNTLIDAQVVSIRP